MNTMEGNKLIYKFSMPEHWEKVKNCSDSFFISLNYHRDWNQLMPVVDKIEQVSINHYTGFTVDIRRKHCCIYCHQKGRMDGIIYQTEWNKERETKILTVWEACVQFIQWYKWYNENKIK